MSDTGLPDERLAAALVAYTARPSDAARAEVLAALAGARVFVAITATSTAEHVDAGTGLRAESSAEMALLTLVGSAGGRAVPLFLDAGGAVAFRDGARPVPLPAPEACGAALTDGAVAVLLDPPGAALAVTGADLAELAAGRVPITGGLSSRRTTAALTDPSEVDPALVQALGAALQPEAVRAARLLAGPDGLVLGLVGDLDAAALAGLASRVLPQVRAVLPPEGLDLAVVGPDGPGREVPLDRAARAGRRGGTAAGDARRAGTATDGTATDGTAPRRGWLRRGR